MRKTAAIAGILGLLASAPAFSLVSLHLSVMFQHVDMFRVNPGLAMAGLALLVGTVIFRLKKAR